MNIDRTTYRSPNFDHRTSGINSIEGITLHTTEGNFPHDAHWLCNPQSRVSAHYVIDRGGGIYCLVDDDKRAWHAGHVWGNNATIGIEISHKQGQPYPKEQFTAVDDLCRYLIGKYNIPATGIVAHRWLTPARKIDPTNMSDEDLHIFIDSLYEPEQELPTPQAGWYRTVYPATVRTAPLLDAGNVVATFAPDSFLLVSWTNGQYVRGSDQWAHLTESELGFIHASALEGVE